MSWNFVGSAGRATRKLGDAAYRAFASSVNTAIAEFFVLAILGVIVMVAFARIGAQASSSPGLGLLRSSIEMLG